MGFMAVNTCENLIIPVYLHYKLRVMPVASLPNTENLSPLLRKALSTIPGDRIDELIAAAFPELLLEPEQDTEWKKVLTELRSLPALPSDKSAAELINNGRKSRNLAFLKST